jgi:hypothetical protein
MPVSYSGQVRFKFRHVESVSWSPLHVNHTDTLMMHINEGKGNLGIMGNSIMAAQLCPISSAPESLTTHKKREVDMHSMRGQPALADRVIAFSHKPGSVQERQASGSLLSDQGIHMGWVVVRAEDVASKFTRSTRIRERYWLVSPALACPNAARSSLKDPSIPNSPIDFFCSLIQIIAPILQCTLLAYERN